VTRGVASLQQYALNFTEPTTTSTTMQQQAQDGMCPSGVLLEWVWRAGALQVEWLAPPPRTSAAAGFCCHLPTPPGPVPLSLAAVGCLNMAMYQFAESTACVCTAAAAQSVRDLAKACNSSAVWALIAVAGLFAGAVFGSMELSADRAMLSADQLFLAVMKRKASRWGRAGMASASRALDQMWLPAAWSCHGPAPHTPANNPRLTPVPATVQVRQQGRCPQGGGWHPQLQQDAVPRPHPARQGRQLALHCLGPRMIGEGQAGRQAESLRNQSINDATTPALQLSRGHASAGLVCRQGATD
jgi:hypothetical protein